MRELHDLASLRLSVSRLESRIAALEDACAVAADVTGDAAWEGGVRRNDAGVAMWDPLTCGGYDGLMPHGPNLNQGAESTLALLATLQHACRCS